MPREAFAAGLDVLRARYDVRYDDGVFAREGYLAGPDERRLAELTAALADPDARAIVMARGGYGLMRCCRSSTSRALVSRPRPIVGFSDGTALLALAARAGVASIHGPVVTQLGSLGAADHGALFARLETPGPCPLLDGLDGLIPGRVRGPLLGGNLEMFSRLIGTPYLPDVAGAILFFEDLGERPYRVDRLLAHLDLAGLFGAASAVIAGDFSACREPEATRADSPTRRGGPRRPPRSPADPGRAGRRFRPRHAQPRAPLRHDVRARHPRRNADGARRRGQLVWPA